MLDNFKLEPKPNNNFIRVIGGLYKYSIHNAFNEKIKCAELGNCDFCFISLKDKSYKSLTRWFLPIYSYRTEKTHIMNFGYTIFSKIAKLAKNPNFGNPINYDMNLFYVLESGLPKYNVVVPYPAPIWKNIPDYKALQNSIDNDYMTSLCFPNEQELSRSAKLARSITLLG